MKTSSVKLSAARSPAEASAMFTDVVPSQRQIKVYNSNLNCV